MKNLLSLSKSNPFWEIPEFQINFWKERQFAWCIIIPVINEGDRIKNLILHMNSLKIHEIADIIIIDGGSTDNSLELEFLKDHKVRGLLTKTGIGKLSAQLRCAYAFALDKEYDGIITIDGNGKDDPSSIPQFIDALGKGFDFIQASRYLSGGIGKNTPKVRDVAIRYIHSPLLSYFSGFRWTDTTQGYRGYSSKLLVDKKIMPFRNIFKTYELLAYLSYRAPRIGLKCMELPTIRHYPETGQIPTKISSIRGNLSVLAILIKACLGFYNPK